MDMPRTTVLIKCILKEEGWTTVVVVVVGECDEMRVSDLNYSEVQSIFTYRLNNLRVRRYNCVIVCRFHRL